MAGDPKSKTRMLVLSGLALALLAGAAMFSTDLLVSRGFGKALEAQRSGLSFDTAAAKARAQATVGDEGYWLTRAEVESPAPFGKPLVVGDRITIAGRDGERQLEVVDLKAIGGNLMRTRTEQVRLLLVTCRVVGPADRAEAPVRFIVEAAAPQPSTPPPAKAL